MNLSGIHFSCMLVDPETVDASWRAILLRAVTSFPQSAFLEEYIQEETRHRNYSISLKHVMARTLGIDSKELEA